MNVLFIGESWLGSCARALREGLREALARRGGALDEVSEDHFAPRASSRALRAVNRLLASRYRRELAHAVLAKCDQVHPEAVVVYKGNSVDAALVRSMKARGAFTVNVFPDYSPHAYGQRLREAIGEYDLVVSTKPFHPSHWSSTYGYSNPCIFVAHGYDPAVHLCHEPPSEQVYDVGLVATWRAEYHEMMTELSALIPESTTVAVAGNGWAQRRASFPRHWLFPGEVAGIAYARWSRKCRIMLAPVNRHVVIDGQAQPGDEDTSRSYELAAAHCFFIHRRTAYIRDVYDEMREVPLFDDAADLARMIAMYLPFPERRSEMAAAAHRRAVPAYSAQNRAAQILEGIHQYRDCPSGEKAA